MSDSADLEEQIKRLRGGVVKGEDKTTASGQESPHIKTLRQQGKLNKLAGKRFRVANGKLEKYEAALPAGNPETTAEIVQEREQAACIIGAKSGHGIFLGVWEPKDRDGVSLKKKFNVFAAPENLPRLMEYAEAVRHIAGLKQWHGHDGAHLPDDAALYEALKKGVYGGGWFIPPGELLFGKDADRKDTMPDNICAHKDKGAFAGTFDAVAAPKGHHPEFYWSSTEPSDLAGKIYIAYLDNGYSAPYIKTDCRLSCRPVRLEPKL